MDCKFHILDFEFVQKDLYSEVKTVVAPEVFSLILSHLELKISFSKSQ